MNTRKIINIIGRILFVEVLLMLPSLLVALLYGDGDAKAFIYTMLPTLAVALVLMAVKQPQQRMSSRDGYFIVAAAWIIISLVGAFPLYLGGGFTSYWGALFEIVSGFTTTGASVLAEPGNLGHGIAFFRCFTHWVGGMGVLVFVMAFLPLSGGQNMHLMKAESTGPSVSKLVPRVRTTALLLYSIYFVLTLIQFVLHLFGGMTVFEALNTAFSTAGTGGFGMYSASFADFSAYNQIVVTVFMILFSISFNSYYFVLIGKLKEAFNIEVKAFLVIVAGAAAIITANIASMFDSVGEALRHSVFTVSSIISTTGFMTVDYNMWPELSKVILVLLMFIGGCAGSTSGGIKVSRILILLKGIGKEISMLIHPREVRKIKLDSHPVEHETVRSANAYMVAYILIYAISVLLISFDNCDFTTNFTSVVAALNNIGPGLEMVGPTQNFGFFSDGTKLVLIFDMLAGRLELFPMLMLITPAAWKKQ